MQHSAPQRRHERHAYLHVAEHWQHVASRDLCGRLNPTHLHMHDPHADASIQWNSRAHRKHRLPYVQLHAGEQPKRPRYRLWGFDFTNISWWIAQLFLWGSVAWVLNGWFLFLPTGHTDLDYLMSSITAVIGGSLFWIGAYLSVVEAVNADNEVITPYHLLHMHTADMEAAGSHPAKQAKTGSTTHAASKSAGSWHQADGQSRGGSAPANGNSADANGCALPSSNKNAVQVENATASKPAKRRYKLWGWRWRDIGYIAVFVQFVGATLFEASVIVGAPYVIAEEGPGNWWTWDAAYWALQTLGAWGFIISAIIFMFECQTVWWKPAPLSVGWHVGLWNLIGAAGFEASAIGGLLDYPPEVPQKWVTYFSTFWGAWAFLIGSYFQLLECLNKHPTKVGQQPVKQ